MSGQRCDYGRGGSAPSPCGLKGTVAHPSDPGRRFCRRHARALGIPYEPRPARLAPERGPCAEFLPYAPGGGRPCRAAGVEAVDGKVYCAAHARARRAAALDERAVGSRERINEAARRDRERAEFLAGVLRSIRDAARSSTRGPAWFEAEAARALREAGFCDL